MWSPVHIRELPTMTHTIPPPLAQIVEWIGRSAMDGGTRTDICGQIKVLNRTVIGGRREYSNCRRKKLILDEFFDGLYMQRHEDYQRYVHDSRRMGSTL